MPELESNSSFQTRIQRFGGLGSTAVAFLLAQYSRGIPGPVFSSSDQTLVVVPNSAVAEQIAADLLFFGATTLRLDVSPTSVGERPYQLYPGWEILPFDLLSPAAEIAAARIATLSALEAGRRMIVIAPIEALMQRLPDKKTMRLARLELSVGQQVGREELISGVERLGYHRVTLVEEVAQFAVRGAVVDVFPVGSTLPVRLELFGESVESIRLFDPGTQRSLRDIQKTVIIAGSEPALILNSTTIDLESSLAKLRERADLLAVPTRETRQLEDGLRSSVPWVGIEHQLPIFAEFPESLLSYFSSEASVVLYNEPAVRRAAEDFAELVKDRANAAAREGRLFPAPIEGYLDLAELESLLDRRVTKTIEPMKLLSQTPFDDHHQEDAESQQLPELSTNEQLVSLLQQSRHSERPFLPLAKSIKKAVESGDTVLIVVGHKARMRRVVELLHDYDLNAVECDGGFYSWSVVGGGVRSVEGRIAGKGSVVLLQGVCSSGLYVPDEKLWLIVDTEIFPEVVSRRRGAATRNVRKFLGNLAQYQENDYVVHIDHGIGLYRGLRQIEIEGSVGDFLALEYAEGAKLFLPVEHIAQLQKYSGVEGRAPVLTRLGGKSWTTTKAKIRETVAELAGQLVKLYAERSMRQGYAFGEIDSEDLRFADTFPFDETPDQERAIADVLSDMAKPQPMDRLVCGDVGFGKTEVALRAAFKAVSSGKQVAVLVPTTILADQHYASFRDRFADFAVQVGCVSRFYTPEENRKTLAELAEGRVDIVVGTHRLVQPDVYFKNLGLVVIDEEHRFGVAHKEKLKKLRSEVDVLTLTATPIPRTLHMSLVAIRDLSVIETPPVDRHAIRTYVATYEDSVVREAILRELGRGGQVFYIYNRVETIASVAHGLSQLVPEARIAFAHGQMKEQELEVIMHRFVGHEIDILVSTTIVESGLDIPNANTIIIRDADRLGLAELYQLRGRVGRSSRRAFAYLLVADRRQLGAEAKKRLDVLQALDDLGMGFRLALQDMEIRGAGNLLGRDQTGKIQLVGFELYSKILQDAVREIQIREGKEDGRVTEIAGGNQGSVLFSQVDPEIHIGFPAHIPPFYIPDVAERLILYQRLVDLRSAAEGVELAEEIEDRFGAIPRDVVLLVELMSFRCFLRQLGIAVATVRGGTLSVTFHPQAAVDRHRVVSAMAQGDSKVRLSPAGALLVTLEPSQLESPASIGHALRGALVRLGMTMPF